MLILFIFAARYYWGGAPHKAPIIGDLKLESSPSNGRRNLFRAYLKGLAPKAKAHSYRKWPLEKGAAELPPWRGNLSCDS